MTLSFKGTAASCLGVSGRVSAIDDIFGFVFNPGLELSLGRQLQLARGQALNINAILVAHEDFEYQDWEETQYAIQFMRDIYAKVGVGVRKIRWQGIPSSDAGGYAMIGSASEAHDLTDDWNGPDGGYLDLFVVRAMGGDSDGVSAVNGPCSKDDKDEMTGAVVSLNGDRDNSGNTFAHEVGHYLGLKHIDDPTNFIGGGPIGSDSEGASNSNTSITESQGRKMKDHCYVKNTC